MHAAYLTEERDDPDPVVDGVGEESDEHVPLSVDLPGVDLVEEGHHDEGVKNHSEMLGRHGVQIVALTVVNIENMVTWKKKKRQK